MKKLYVFLLLLFYFSGMNAQEKDIFRKGSMILFWGWNRAKYSNSDIHFKGQDYNLQLNQVVAHDRPTDFSFRDYFHPLRVTIPQTNTRIGYFIKDNVALVLAVDHMKYVMDQDQTVDASGTISNPYASYIKDAKVDLSDEQFLTFEHTDGLNYVNVGAEKYQPLIQKDKFDLYWAYGGGVGVLYPKTNAKLFGNERSDRFHIAGFGADVRTNINVIFWKHLIARVEVKYGYINMPDIKTTLRSEDTASQDFMFGQINFGIGYVFGTKKNKL